MSLRISTDAFDLTGIQPLLGRTFRPGDELVMKGGPIVISHALWSRRLSADPAAIGKSLTLDNKVYTIVGVMPPGFAFPPSLVFGGRDLMFNTEVWTPRDVGDGPPSRERFDRARSSGDGNDCAPA